MATTTQSLRFSINSEDLKKEGISLLITVGAAVLYTAYVWLQGGSFDFQTLLDAEKVTIWGAVVNAFKLWLQGPAR